MRTLEPWRGIPRLRGIRFAMVVACLVTAPLAAQENRPLTEATSSLFSGSGTCEFCHTSSGGAMVTPSGEDVSVIDDWRSTMMANAARDPLWQAKVESEIARNPALSDAIQTKCTRCHAPAGNQQAVWDGDETYRLSAMDASPLARDGVTCTACHQVLPENLGTDESYSGGFVIDDRRQIFGQYRDPFQGPMNNHVAYRPVYGEHMERSELCATCHTLFTAYVNDEGEVGGAFPEQAPYLEWRNSVYPTRGTECQSCHVPSTDEPVKISSRPGRLTARSPFGRHHFVGGNTWLLEVLRDHADELGVTATTAQFDRTIARTRQQLAERTADVTATGAPTGDTLEVAVRVENRTGHKLPTGFPSRRAWLHLSVTNGSGAPVFTSGAPEPDGGIAGLAPGLTPHYERITRETEVQVWEARMGDVNGEPTFTLLRASHYLKDNRIPPAGFVTDAPGYEDIAIVGAAAADPDFNRDDDAEGTGADTIRYAIDTSGHEGPFSVVAELLYQAVMTDFTDDLFVDEGSRIERFREYWREARKTPETIGRVVFDVTPEPLDAAFRRGDFNADGSLNIVDPIGILAYLFQSGDRPPCHESADVQPSGTIDVSDAVFLLIHLFSAGQPPGAPFPDCGTPPTSRLGCDAFPPCDD